MKKIIFMVVVLTLVMITTGFAMTFQQPLKIGESISVVPDAAFNFKNATSNDGERHKLSPKAGYGKGMVCFGNGNDAIYFHYNSYLKYPDNMKNSCRWGSKDISNTVQLNVLEATANIYQIKNDAGILLYQISIETGASGYVDIIGTRKDGTWVKYIDSKDIIKRYFGSTGGISPYAMFNISVQSNIIIIPYIHNGNKEGEFRFKWDEAAQWFGVEQVVY